MDMVWLCLYPPSRIIPDGGDKGENKMPILGYKPGPVPPNLTLWNYIVDEIRRTRSPKVYRYLMSLLADTPKFDRGMMNYQLAGMAWAGDMTMVWYLLDIGANPSAETTTGQGTPLAHAVRACDDDIVHLLLERGDNPSKRGLYHRGTTLTAAAKAGSMVMMRKLLNAGAELSDLRTAAGGYYTLSQAVKMEHTAMVKLLLDIAPGFLPRIAARHLRLAETTGLESIADLLRSRGVVLSIDVKKPWTAPQDNSTSNPIPQPNGSNSISNTSSPASNE